MKLLKLVIFILMVGCGSMINGKHQNITISPINDKDQEKTSCNLKNEEGSWKTTPNYPASIRRDGNNLEIQCKNDLQTGISSVEPNFERGLMALNFLLDLCTFSCAYDGIENTLYEYPSFVTVPMRDIDKK